MRMHGPTPDPIREPGHAVPLADAVHGRVGYLNLANKAAGTKRSESGTCLRPAPGRGSSRRGRREDPLRLDACGSLWKSHLRRASPAASPSSRYRSSQRSKVDLAISKQSQVVLMLPTFSASSTTRFMRPICRKSSVIQIGSVILCHHHDRVSDWIRNITTSRIQYPSSEVGPLLISTSRCIL